MKNLIIPFLFIFFLFTITIATRLDPQSDKHNSNNKKGGRDDSSGGFFGPGTGPGFNIPGMGNNWPGNGVGGGYGSGYGGPKGGHSKSGVVSPTVVCKDKGPCYKKKLTCPAKCFTAYSRSGKGYGGGGGGGGCTMDCKKCVAYC
ncbi:glycine-rich RNA-binding protein 1 [Lactuca sativa]|uniref:glycine-rich RNA-binding protein 1 n=1 Tax=Lactuca sativa TaxID=4236 RepID=UPI000CCB44FA|nr:glycine-rich RNA-binding protein 1 [Lactuca sativa]